MKIKADWGLIRADVVLAAVFSLIFAGGMIKRFGFEDVYTRDVSWSAFWIFFAALMLFFCWRIVSDLAKALFRVLSINREAIDAPRAVKSLGSASEKRLSGPARQRDGRALPRPTRASRRARG